MNALRKYHDAIGYRKFEQDIKSAERLLQETSPSFLGYGQESVARRLVQRRVELSLSQFLTGYAPRYEGNEAADKEAPVIEAGGLQVNRHDGRIKCTLKLAIRARSEFFVHWSYVLWIHLLAFFSRPKEQGKTSLLLGDWNRKFLQPGKSDPIRRLLFKWSDKADIVGKQADCPGSRLENGNIPLCKACFC